LGLVWPVLAQTSQDSLKIYTLRLDRPTVLKGYTFVAPDSAFKVGVVDKAVVEPITVRFKEIPDSYMLTPLKKAPGRLASPIWEFDLLFELLQENTKIERIMSRKITFFNIAEIKTK